MTIQAPVPPAESLRAFFRNHASGVAIVTGVNAASEPIGFTATSLTSLGTNPPLVSFNVAQGASFYQSLCEGAHVNLHSLTVENLDLAARLAGPREGRFSVADWTSDANGVPLFSAVSAILNCRILKVVEIEKNSVVIAEAISGQLGQAGEPLIYHSRAFKAGGQTLRQNG